MAIAVVQTKTNNSGGSGVTTLTVTFDATPTAGNLIVLVASGLSTSAAGLVSQTTGIVWTYYQLGTSNQTTLLIGFGRVFGSASSTITVANFGTGGISIVATELSGENIRVDRMAEATGSGTAVSTGTSQTTSTANEMWVAGLSHRLSGGTTFSLPTNSFSILGQDKSALSTTADRSAALLALSVSSTGTAATGATASGSGNWCGAVFTLQENPAGGAGGGSVFGSQGGVIT